MIRIARVVAVFVVPCCASLSWAVGVPNEPLTVQAPVSGPGFASSAQLRPGGPTTRYADTVEPLFIPARVYRVDWWGGNDLSPGSALANVESFDITVYSLFGGGVLYHDTITLDRIVIESTPNTVGSFNETMHHFSYQSNQTMLFPGGPAASISIAANYINDAPGAPLFLWANSNHGDATLLVSTDGGPFVPTTGGGANAAFALYGASPAPGAAPIFALGALAATRRRRN